MLFFQFGDYHINKTVIHDDQTTKNKTKVVIQHVLLNLAQNKQVATLLWKKKQQLPLTERETIIIYTLVDPVCGCQACICLNILCLLMCLCVSKVSTCTLKHQDQERRGTKHGL